MRPLVYLLTILLSCSARAQSPIQLTPGAVTSGELVTLLTQLDARLFDAGFSCSLDALAPLLHPELEFIHDKHGRTATSADGFLRGVRDGCAAQAQGRDFRARRELVPGTLTTHALDRYGAVQTGIHRFYALQPGQPDRLTETARFIHLWRQDGDQWRLARAVSYDHVLADPPAP